LYQSSRFDRNELAEAYNDYVAEYKKDQEYEFYKEHKSEPWFVEKYDPSQIYIWKMVQIELAKIQAKNF
jgi:formylmethanofuran dehydrogenase subunit E